MLAGGFVRTPLSYWSVAAKLATTCGTDDLLRRTVIALEGAIARQHPAALYTPILEACSSGTSVGKKFQAILDVVVFSIQWVDNTRIVASENRACVCVCVCVCVSVA
jgi:hypothetical protein